MKSSLSWQTFGEDLQIVAEQNPIAFDLVVLDENKVQFSLERSPQLSRTEKSYKGVSIAPC